MDHKRALLAISLSLAFLVLWSWFFGPDRQSQPPGTVPPAAEAPSLVPAPSPISPSPETQAAAPAQPLDSKDSSEPPALDLGLGTPSLGPSSGQRLSVTTPLYEAVLNSEGGVMEHFVLLQYRQGIAPGSPHIDLINSPEPAKRPMGLLWNRQPTWMQGEWSVAGKDLTLFAGETGSLVFTGSFGPLELIRELQFSGDSYLITEQVFVRNHSLNQISATLGFTMASDVLSAIKDRYTPTQITYFDAGGYEKERSEKKLLPGIQAENGIRWGAIQSNYFLTAVVPAFESPIFKAKLENGVHRAVIETPTFVLDPRMELQFSTTYYLGPREKDSLSLAPNNLEAALHYGWFDIIAKPLIHVLNFFYGYVQNYGLAIILLTIVIKLLFWPLSQKSYKSMQQMKKLQPMMLKLREKYKDDRQKMNQEMMQLYKTYKVNPLGGCLPIAVQIPVFISLYQALMGAIELRHAPFISHVPFTDIIWLADLSAKDPFYVTPIIMGATMFLQQKLTPAPGDPMQAKIMMFLPIVFTFLFLSFPSGLVLYWLVNNILSIAQQWWVMRKAA
ncbi:MAG TPA: membrane protein insertase YidC [Desulfonatronum sp.]|nr:membrane protein insertase YidC [Desulfonatronum sp.]